ncbi:hypothetical protein PIB30_086411 [Stylosanthes scabra]|uniref:Uncharacterized protein n=1 Tax=Stylosanthes scabra TaxID=79078 RepID=A0ABU6XUW9_9FABA|nr:hypothetical protein [Stylosanthes scabra]
MIAPANVCTHNHHKRASEGNGAAVDRPRGAHLLAIRCISAGMIAPANVCAHNHHKRASEGNGAAAERPRGPVSSPWSPALPDVRPAGVELPGRGSAAGRTGKKEVQHEDFPGGHSS